MFRYDPNSLSFNTSTALRTIYSHPKADIQKADRYSINAPNKEAQSTFNVIDRRSHARKRRVLSHAFSDHAIKSIQDYVVNNVTVFTDVIGEKRPPPADVVVQEETGEKGWTRPQNMSRLCDWLTFDIMGDLCFGKAFGMLERPDTHFVADLIAQASRRNFICGTWPILAKLHLDRLFFPTLAVGRHKFMAFGRQQAKERTELGDKTNRKDFFYYLLNAKDPETGEGYSAQELWGEASLLIIAGSDTSSTALSSAFFYLGHNPQPLARLEKEILSTFSSVEEIVSGPKLNSCTYLRGCIDESMRMGSPVGGILPRKILSSSMEIDNHFIPAGINVGIASYALHHNPEYYPSPYTFKPERFLPEFTSEDDVAVAQSAFCPFSIGKRGCIGKGLAYTELVTVLARTVYLYEMKLASQFHIGEGNPELGIMRNKKEEFQLWDTFTSRKDGPYMQFRART